jgi:ACS family hexuronate transporter-like MFS transporter
VAWITLTYGWHAAFIIPGTIGLAVAALWVLIYRDPPHETAAITVDQPGSNDGAKFTWPQLWKTRSLWGILLCRFISDPVWYFCLFWLPGYLQERLGLTLEQMGFVGWIPFLAADLGGVGTAAWSDYMVKRGMSPLRARKVMLISVAMLGPLCALTPHLPYPAFVLALFGVVGAVCLSWLFSLSVVIAETFPKANVGSVLGIAAGFGGLGAMVFNAYVGDAMERFGPTPIFVVMALLHPIAAIVLWTMVRPERPST